MSDYGYVASQELLGDFTFALTYDASSFGAGAGGLNSWGIVPAAGVLSGNAAGLVQSTYPDRPFFNINGGSGNVQPMGDSIYGVTATTGDVFSMHRNGSIVRFYKNFQLEVSPLPLYEATYTNGESFRFYAEFTRSSGTIGIEGEYGTMEYKLAHAYRYTVAQQTEDFGGAQNPVKVRVAQESALVGIGDYIEANL